MANLGIPERHNHPWAKMLRSAMAEVQPELLKSLEELGQIDQYLSVEISRAMHEIRGMQAQGVDYETAKELVLDDLIPKEAPVTEDWEEEGCQEDEFAILDKWAEGYAANAAEDDDEDE